jgi:PAS domain S-box-containing protein
MIAAGATRGWRDSLEHWQARAELLEQQLADSERRLRDIVEVSGDWVWDTDREHRFVIVGTSVTPLGLSPESFLGKTRWEVAGADPATDEAWARHKEDLDAHRPFRNFRYSVANPAGGRLCLLASGKPVFDADGNFTGYRGTTTNETPMVEALARAEQAEAMLRDAIESISDVFVICDAEGRLVLFNQAMTTRYADCAASLRPGALFGDFLRDAMAKGYFPDAVGHEETWLAAQLNHRRRGGRVSEHRLRDGSWILLREHRLRDGGIASLGVDITAHKAALAALRASEERFVQAQKMEAIGNLTGGLAHDFNNLLGIVIGNLDLLREGGIDAGESDAMAKDALDAALRGADLTRRLLAFARRQPLQPRRSDVNALIVEITTLLGRTLGQDIEIQLDRAPDLWPVIVDPAQLEAAITNLATNARDAMPDGGRLVITTRNGRLDEDYAAQHADATPGEYIVIEVSDTGVGMPPDTLSRVFEPFFTTKEQGKGTGLGLSMVFGFMKQSGGHINVYSELGSGTTFRLYLPRATPHVAATAAAENAPALPLPRGGERVLVVEDNPKLLSVVVRQLTELGYEVLAAESAPAALGILSKESKIELLLTDIVMPGGMNGMELAQDAVRRWPRLKVLLTSGFPEARLGGKARLAPGCRLLSKPYRKDELARLVRTSIDEPRPRSEDGHP